MNLLRKINRASLFLFIIVFPLSTYAQQYFDTLYNKVVTYFQTKTEYEKTKAAIFLLNNN